MLFNEKYAFFCFFVCFQCYLVGSLHFDNFPCYSMGILGFERDIRMDEPMEIHPCVLQDIGPLGRGETNPIKSPGGTFPRVDIFF